MWMFMNKIANRLVRYRITSAPAGIKAAAEGGAPRRPGRVGERSFSLIETVIALAIMTFLIIEVAAVQGNSIVFSDYGRNVTVATWLAKRVMSNVEYRASFIEFKELLTSEKDLPFEDYPDFRYSIETTEWKLSLSKILEMAMGGGFGGDADDDDAAKKPGGFDGNFIESGVRQVFGEEPIFLTSRVEVSWAEGAQRNSTGITHLFTNQKKLDAYLGTLKPVWDELMKPKPPPGQPQKKGGGPAEPAKLEGNPAPVKQAN